MTNRFKLEAIKRGYLKMKRLHRWNEQGDRAIEPAPALCEKPDRLKHVCGAIEVYR